ncbi:MAG: porin [Flavobacteriales bacterium]|nr:porin [Flavobacteriales bacterium]
MKRIFIVTLIIILYSNVRAQNSAEKIVAGNSGLHIGGYGQVDFNLNERKGTINNNGKLDVHRLVTFFGYNFNDKVSFVSEVEFEHVSEVYVEQAFLDYKINNNLSVNAGLMLIPMGIQNLYHEPPTFNGVERTNVDKYIIPTTWREMGFGISGRSIEHSINYQAMLVNGFNGYDDGGVFSGKSGLRSGRQKGAESYITYPDFAGRVSYYGNPGLNLGFSAYLGDSESKAYDGLDLSDDVAVSSADSTIVGIQMIGIDARYIKGSVQFTGQYVIADLSNTDQYNVHTGKDLGSKLTGYYYEIGYNLMDGIIPSISSNTEELIAFARYENYNTHAETEGIAINDAYNRTEITFGLGFKVAKGAVFKADYQIKSNSSSDDETGQFNFGVGVWF